jgi:hypothetical protein
VLGKRKQAFNDLLQAGTDCLRRSLKGGLKRDNPEDFALLGFLFLGEERIKMSLIIYDL